MGWPRSFYGPSKGPWTVKPIVVLGPIVVGSGFLDHEPYHGSCEGPQTVKVDVVLFLGWWPVCSGLRTLSQPVNKTTTPEGLCGLMLSLGTLTLHHGHQYDPLGGPRPVKGPMAHLCWRVLKSTCRSTDCRPYHSSRTLLWFTGSGIFLLNFLSQRFGCYTQ